MYVLTRSIVTVLLVGALSACVRTQSKTMGSWVGRPAEDLVQAWGVPDRTETLSDGSRVLTWVSVWANESGQHTCRKNFTVDPQGRVQRWSYGGCPNWWIEAPL